MQRIWLQKACFLNGFWFKTLIILSSKILIRILRCKKKKKSLMCYYHLSFGIKWESTNTAHHKMTAGEEIRLKLKRKRNSSSQQVRTSLLSPGSSLQSARSLARCHSQDSFVFGSRFSALRTEHQFIWQIRQITASQLEGGQSVPSTADIICDW